MTNALHPPIPGKNKYLVWDEVGQSFVPFVMKLGEVQVGNFLEMLVPPPVRREGFLSYKKQVFKVTLPHLLRNKVDVSRPYQYPVITSEPTSAEVVRNPSFNTVNLGPVQDDGGEVSKEADLLFKNQIGTLYSSPNSEERWDF